MTSPPRTRWGPEEVVPHVTEININGLPPNARDVAGRCPVDSGQRRNASSTDRRPRPNRGGFTRRTTGPADRWVRGLSHPPNCGDGTFFAEPGRRVLMG